MLCEKIVKGWYNLDGHTHGLAAWPEQLWMMVYVWSVGKGRRNRSLPFVMTKQFLMHRRL
jgi:hypothetical protein